MRKAIILPFLFVFVIGLLIRYLTKPSITGYVSVSGGKITSLGEQ